VRSLKHSCCVSRSSHALFRIRFLFCDRHANLLYVTIPCVIHDDNTFVLRVNLSDVAPVDGPASSSSSAAARFRDVYLNPLKLRSFEYDSRSGGSCGRNRISDVFYLVIDILSSLDHLIQAPENRSAVAQSQLVNLSFQASTANQTDNREIASETCPTVC